MEILFHGCSFLEGVGLPGLTQDSDNFTNIIGQQLGGNITNMAKGGNSNERIFLETVCEITKKRYDIVIIGWTSYPRHVFWPGLELFECRRSMTPIKENIIEHNGNDIAFSSRQFEKIRQWFMTLTHDHYHILDICRYVTAIKSIVEEQGGKIFFVNAIAQWDTGYFEQFDRLSDIVVRPDMLTNYTNQLLNSDNRDDEQIDALFHLMGRDYQQVGNIQHQNWLNLYQSLKSLMIDTGNDNFHPGPLSHKKYADLLLKNIKT